MAELYPARIFVNLDTFLHNWNLHKSILQQRGSNKTDVNSQIYRLSVSDHCCSGVIAVVKGNGYGHGSVMLAKCLQEAGEDTYLAVASLIEAIQLRKEGITLPIIVLGSQDKAALASCFWYNLVPSVSSEDGIVAMAEEVQRNNNILGGKVCLVVDTGLSRYGCKSDELPKLLQICSKHDISIEGIYSHFADTDDDNFTKMQLEVFLSAIKKYRAEGIPCHISSSRSFLIPDPDMDMDYVRLGKASYGYPADRNIQKFVSHGYRPVLSLRVRCTLVKKCPTGSLVGYSCTYKCKKDEWIATLPFGKADGYPKELGNVGKVKHIGTGILCDVVGHISSDSFTAVVPEAVKQGDDFEVITADFEPYTSIASMSHLTQNSCSEISYHLSRRIPRIYTKEGEVVAVTYPQNINLEDLQ